MIELRTVALVLCLVTGAIQIYRDEFDSTNGLLMFIALGVWWKCGCTMFDVFVLCFSYALGVDQVRRGTYSIRELWLLLICASLWLR
mgnify:CR=1 FL=1